MRLVGASEQPLWAFKAEPLDDELLSSYLIRAAHRHGLSPYRFCAYYFPGIPIWNRDIDRSASPLFIKNLALVCGHAQSNLMPLLLNSPTRTNLKAGITPWINAVGIFHRKRRRFGQLYCPECLRESAYFRKRWRHSAVTCCEKHGCELLDSCMACGSSLAPHRQFIDIAQCGFCSADLRAPQCTRASEHERRVAFQRMLISAGYGESILMGPQLISGIELLKGARVLISVFGNAFLRSKNSVFDTALLKHALADGLERCRLQERRCLLSILMNLMENWPVTFFETADRFRLAQPRFPLLSDLPSWLATEIALLPIGFRWRDAQTRRVSTTEEKIHALTALNDPNWRTSRANILLRTVKIKFHER